MPSLLRNRICLHPRIEEKPPHPRITPWTTLTALVLNFRRKQISPEGRAVERNSLWTWALGNQDQISLGAQETWFQPPLYSNHLSTLHVWLTKSFQLFPSRVLLLRRPCRAGTADAVSLREIMSCKISKMIQPAYSRTQRGVHVSSSPSSFPLGQEAFSL